MYSNTILFTWEIGQGFGHVLPLLPVARELLAQGHRVVFALRDVRDAGALLKGEGFTVLQAPTHPDQFFPAHGPQPQTMADILRIFGFASKQNLFGLVAAWEGLFALCKPDVVVASYAPLSLLCARQAGIPTVLMALPFELPAAVHPSPSFRNGKLPANALSDERVINTVNAVFGSQFIASVHDIFQATQVFLMSFAELDCFAPRKDVAYCGSLFVTDVGIPPKWPDGDHPFKVLAYLHASLPDLGRLRQAIQESPYAYCIFLRDADEALLREWSAPNVCVLMEAVRLDQALKDCDAVLSYGGAGFVCASLLTGRPVVLYVRNLEGALNAQQVVKLGAGLFPQPQTPKNIRAALDAVFQRKAYRLAAQDFSAAYRDHSPAVAAKKIAAIIADLARNSCDGAPGWGPRGRGLRSGAG